MKLAEALEKFYSSMDGVLSPKTILFYKDRLKSLAAFTGEIELKDITTHQLRTWRAQLNSQSSKWGKGSSHPATQGTISPYYLHQFIRSAKRFFAWCTQEGFIDLDPGFRLEKPYLPKRRPRGISEEDRDKLIQAAEGDPRSKAIVLFLADTACRVGGLAHLLTKDVDLIKGMATIREKGRGGWGKERPVFFGKETAGAIREWLKVRPCIPDLDYLFIGRKRGLYPGWSNLGEDGIRMTLKRLANKVGITKGHNPHNFRHAAIRAWLDAGMPISEVAVVAGHSSVYVTADFYGIVSETKLKEDHEKFTWLKGKKPCTS